jgi:hypothetical protein
MAPLERGAMTRSEQQAEEIQLAFEEASRAHVTALIVKLRQSLEREHREHLEEILRGVSPCDGLG